MYNLVCAISLRNLKKIFSLELIEETEKLAEGEAHRPAMLYRFKKKIGEFIGIL